MNIFNKSPVIVLAPHTDDGEIGCGGLISRLIENGVASSIGNLHEAIVCNIFDNFEGASEGNGFARLTADTIQNSPKLNSGCLEWVDNPEIDISQFNKELYSLIIKSQQKVI